MINSPTNASWLQSILSATLHKNISRFEAKPVSGGSINQTLQVVINDEEKYFCKINSINEFPGLFQKEKNGLETLAEQSNLRIPEVISIIEDDKKQILIMEWIEPATPGPSFWKIFGEQLSHLHQISSTKFGFTEDNYMGALEQSNFYHDTWNDFFIEERLEPQIKLATAKNLFSKNHRDQFNSLYKKIPGIFSPELPSLLHGDLWSGNYICDKMQNPVLVDPAVYYGHRNVDLGMTTLFGGFAPSFYESYNYHYPFPTNYKEQWEICNLYPLLIHLNLFGINYRSEIEIILKKYS